MRGDREIVLSEAEIIRRIFQEFAAGVDPRAIAKQLKEHSVAGPEGRLWNDTTIRGHVRRGTEGCIQVTLQDSIVKITGGPWRI
ncbi:recombinase family protein [Mesorhizobium zhangyense]|uniref:recombinase family protein n=1 Tax=Mesorhizobium zhangyense TaxID=1776730 RepID=UPI00197BE74A|nr:recombinase family protein [Mesorhizobium zhangyense]